MKEKLWVQNEKVGTDLMEKFPELNPVILQLLTDRGLTTEEDFREFLSPDYEQHVHDPFLFTQMKNVVELIFSLIEKQELIYVYGDYDADGVCASTILKTTIEKLGGKAKVYLPHREKDGYGLTKKGIDIIASENASLLITTDCGVTNVSEVEYAKEKGLEVVVTDHHAPPEVLPDCLILHPQLPNETYPYKFLAGGGVAFKLAQGLLRTKAKESGTPELLYFEKWLLDLVAISTVADMMPLLGENRTLVKYGLLVLNKAKRLGIRHLLLQAGLLDEKGIPKRKLDAYSIGFQIGPRINAAGRMNHANVAYNLLISTDEQECLELANKLEENNNARKDLVAKVMTEALVQIGEVNADDKKLLMAYNKEWPLGVVGLVAGKIVEKHYLPTVVLGELDSHIAGSARSISGFNFVDGLREMPELFSKFGGHAMAAGFTFAANENKEVFLEKMTTKIQEKLTDEDILPKLKIDSELLLTDIHWDFLELLKKCEPHGKENPSILFLSKNLKVQSVRGVGTDKQHLKIDLTDDLVTPFGGIGFNMPEKCKSLSVGDKVDVVYGLEENVWNGNREIHLKL